MIRPTHLPLIVLLASLVSGTVALSTRADESSGNALEAALGEYLDGNFLQAARALTPLAENGGTEAQYILGDMLLHRRGPRTFWQGPRWIDTYLAEYPEDAQAGIATQKAGLRWLSQAVAKEHAGAQYSLGLFGTTDWTSEWENAGFSPENAVQLIESAALAGIAAASFKLGNMHLTVLLWDSNPITRRQDLPEYVPKGLGKTERARHAKDAFKRALEDGYGKAAAYLGLMYEKGLLGLENEELALRYYKVASKYGDFFLLGEYLEAHPKDGRVDYAEAYKWYYLAAQFSQGDSKKRKQALAAKLSPTERSEVEAESNEFLNDILRNRDSVLAKALAFCSRMPEGRNPRALCRQLATSTHFLCNYFFYKSALYPEFEKTRAYSICRQSFIDLFFGR